MFITAFTNARQLPLSWVGSIQSITPNSTSWRSILILSFHLCLDLPSGLISRVSPQNNCTRFSSPHTCYMPRPSHSSRFYHPNNIWWAVQIIKFLVMFLSPLLCHLVRRRPKYSSQHPFLKHPQPKFLPQYERPSFTPIKKTVKIIVLRSQFLNFWIANRKTKYSAPNDSKHCLTSICF